MKKILLNIGIVIISLIVLLGIFMTINGSLEMYPTDEQISKTRLVYGIITFVFLIIDIILIAIRTKYKGVKNEKN